MDECQSVFGGCIYWTAPDALRLYGGGPVLPTLRQEVPVRYYSVPSWCPVMYVDVAVVRAFVVIISNGHRDGMLPYFPHAVQKNAQSGCTNGNSQNDTKQGNGTMDSTMEFPMDPTTNCSTDIQG
jgi:hypothetical protein